jgi:hypothetical protein
MKMAKTAAGFDLEQVLRQTIAMHSCRKQCRFREDAVDWLMAQPEWAAFVAKLEEAEIDCEDRQAA